MAVVWLEKPVPMIETMWPPLTEPVLWLMPSTHRMYGAVAPNDEPTLARFTRSLCVPIGICGAVHTTSVSATDVTAHARLPTCTVMSPWVVPKLVPVMVRALPALGLDGERSVTAGMPWSVYMNRHVSSEHVARTPRTYTATCDVERTCSPVSHTISVLVMEVMAQTALFAVATTAVTLPPKWLPVMVSTLPPPMELTVVDSADTVGRTSMEAPVGSGPHVEMRPPRPPM
mmetsp:Transcript_21376/g.66305  ORF Transcript_21376/g.66305 Transcript_21376/m.66305 type:complete len:230 (+) Transcript_21376:151-840(+)